MADLDLLARVKQLTPRDHSLWEFQCMAPSALFLEWEDIPQMMRDEIDANGALPCDGGGATGPWCTNCRFGNEEEYQE